MQSAVRLFAARGAQNVWLVKLAGVLGQREARHVVMAVVRAEQLQAATRFVSGSVMVGHDQGVGWPRSTTVLAGRYQPWLRCQAGGCGRRKSPPGTNQKALRTLCLGSDSTRDFPVVTSRTWRRSSLGKDAT